MMFYQYMPIKMVGAHDVAVEPRLQCFSKLIGAVCCDFIGTYGLDRYVESYAYITAKQMFQAPGKPFNRPGYHSDGYMSDDINYIWSDKSPTIFNVSEFSLSKDDAKSMVEMEEQASPENEVTYSNNSLLRLDQYVIHKLNDNAEQGMRTFLKVSFSKDKYDLIGNAHNYLLDYDWEMKPRSESRNIPQSNFKPKID